MNGSGLNRVESGFMAPGGRAFAVEWAVDEERDASCDTIVAPVRELGTVHVPLSPKQSVCSDGKLSRQELAGVVREWNQSRVGHAIALGDHKFGCGESVEELQRLLCVK